MINIINVNIHKNDKRNISSVDIKLKYFPDGNNAPLEQHPLVGTIMSAFCNTTFLTDVGKDVKMTPNPNRADIVDLTIRIRESEKANNLTNADIGKFLDAFQTNIDTEKLFAH